MGRRTLTPWFVIAALAVTACTDGTAAPTTTAAPVGSPATTTQPATTATTGPAPSTTTTTTPPTTTTSAPDLDPLPTLGDGRPATFLGITTDYEAVEVDTRSGTVLRSLGRVSDAEDVANAECAACVNALDAIWRTADGAWFAISECCEPAAGVVHILRDEELPLRRDTEGLVHNAWTAAPAPGSHEFAFLGYDIAVGIAGDELHRLTFIEDGLARAGPAWKPDRTAVSWIEERITTEEAVLVSHDLVEGRVTEVTLGPADEWHVSGLAATSTGSIVTIRHDLDSDGAVTASTGIELTLGGRVLHEFELVTGAALGSFDPTGRWMILVGDDGTVRWRALDGEQGTLAEGYVFASW